MPDHPRHLHHPPELHLSPLAADRRGFEGLGEGDGGGLEVRVGPGELLELLREPLVGPLAFLLDLPEMAVQGRQVLPDRVHQILERQLVSGPVAPDLGEEPRNLLVGPFQKLPRLPGQGLVGQGMEGIPHLVRCPVHPL